MPQEQAKNTNPQQSQFSHFKLFSLGVVAKDKEKDKKTIEVYLTETLPMHEGEITDKSQKITNKGITDPNNKDLKENFEVSQNRGITITALWMGENNRVTAPNVKQGERVKLWTIDGTEQYYWEPCGLDQELRRTERIVWTFASSKDPKEKKLTPDSTNQYTFEINTEDGHVTFTSGKGNNEHIGYKFQINSKQGNVTLTDDGKNPHIIQLDSKGGRISLQNSKKSFIVLDGDTIKMKAKNFQGEFENTDWYSSNYVRVDTPTATFTKNVVIQGNETVNGNETIGQNSTIGIELTVPTATIPTLTSSTISGITVGSGDV